MFVKIFDNYHAGISQLPASEQDAFYGAVMRYAFDGEEPEFDGIKSAVWATIKPFIDKSTKGQENGSKGGNGRGNANTGKTDSETHSEKGGGKGGSKTHSENHRNRKEGNGKGNPEGSFSNSEDAPCGADAAGAAPPAACPDCGGALRRTASHKPNGSVLYLCDSCNGEVWT